MNAMSQIATPAHIYVCLDTQPWRAQRSFNPPASNQRLKRLHGVSQFEPCPTMHFKGVLRCNDIGTDLGLCIDLPCARDGEEENEHCLAIL
jgi:hypothetical protein